MKNLIHLLIVSLLLTNVWADWKENSKRICDDNNMSYQQALETANKLNDLVKRNDKVAISKMVEYPVRIIKRKKSGDSIYYYIKTDKDFLGQYDSLFTPALKKLLNEDHKVVCSSLMMIGTAGGHIWLSESFDIMSISPK